MEAVFGQDDGLEKIGGEILSAATWRLNYTFEKKRETRD